jgi:hypothetical protein
MFPPTVSFKAQPSMGQNCIKTKSNKQVPSLCFFEEPPAIISFTRTWRKNETVVPKIFGSKNKISESYLWSLLPNPVMIIQAEELSDYLAFLSE